MMLTPRNRRVCHPWVYWIWISPSRRTCSASPTWRSCRVSPCDVTSFRQRWPKRLFQTLRKRWAELDKLHQDNCSRPEWKFPSRCSLYQEDIAAALDQHMMEVYLALGQLWRCPVEWCTVWKGSASDCLVHVGKKHGGSENVVVDKLEKTFSPVDCDPRLLAGGSSAGRVWCGSGRPAVPRLQVPVVSQIQGVPG